jgi:hypothetical protein
MMFASYPALHQEPANLMHPTRSMDEIREAELENLGARITEAASINAMRAKRLNRLRIAAALSPLIFAVVAAFSPARLVAKVEPSMVICHFDLPASAAARSRIECRVSK